jgi:cytochrome d ubiquinol oxidase subunit II
METLTILQIIWFILIGVLFVGYSVLDGFDLGVGSLLPFLAGSDEKKTEVLMKSVGPVWDGNEVWLLTGGGALFAAFPHAYATVFSGFYLALMLVLVGLILRAVSIEFYMNDEHKARWRITFFLGTLIPSILFGVALGNVVQGIPLDNKMEFTGNFFTLLRPFPLSLGLLGLFAILMQGVTYTILKTDSELNEKAYSLSGKIYYGYIIMFILAIIASFIFIPDKICNVLAWIATAIFIISMVWLKLSLAAKKEMKAFIASSLAFISLWGITGAIHFPNLVRATGDSTLNITIKNASSSELTLTVMLIIAVIGMPIVIAYTAYAYKIFRGKITLK